MPVVWPVGPSSFSETPGWVHKEADLRGSYGCLGTSSPRLPLELLPVDYSIYSLYALGEAVSGCVHLLVLAKLCIWLISAPDHKIVDELGCSPKNQSHNAVCITAYNQVVCCCSLDKAQLYWLLRDVFVWYSCRFQLDLMENCYTPIYGMPFLTALS